MIKLKDPVYLSTMRIFPLLGGKIYVMEFLIKIFSSPFIALKNPSGIVLVNSSDLPD